MFQFSSSANARAPQFALAQCCRAPVKLAPSASLRSDDTKRSASDKQHLSAQRQLAAEREREPVSHLGSSSSGRATSTESRARSAALAAALGDFRGITFICPPAADRRAAGRAIGPLGANWPVSSGQFGPAKQTKSNRIEPKRNRANTSLGRHQTVSSQVNGHQARQASWLS